MRTQDNVMRICILIRGIAERGSASVSAGRPWRSPLGTRIAEGKRAESSVSEKVLFVVITEQSVQMRGLLQPCGGNLPSS